MASKIMTLPERVRQGWGALTDRAKRGGAFGDGKEDAGKILHAKLWHTLTMVPQFSITLVNGSAIGYGLALPAISDMVISLKNAYFNISDAKMGRIDPTL